jgi:hypothetical protein
MDTSQQRHELEATGWQRGLYDDIKRTFRAPIVNWIFRTALANEPAVTRYAWGQVKPVFETRAFARFTVEYRDAVLSALDVPATVTRYRPADLGLDPTAYRELRGQLATYDVVGPRLAVLFETMDCGLHGRLDPEPPDDRAVTAPFPETLDRDRGRSPTLVDAVPDEIGETTAAIRAFHGLGDQLPSIYRTLGQWPGALETVWADLDPRFESDDFDDACEAVATRVDAFVDDIPYTPRLAPADLEALFDEDAVTDLQELFREFNTGPVETVLPTLPVFAATVDAEGARSFPVDPRTDTA